MSKRSEPENEIFNLSRRASLHALAALACGAWGASASHAAVPSTGFLHPGLLHTDADLQRMAANLGTEPLASTWALLTSNGASSLGRTPAPVPVVYRGFDGVNRENYGQLFRDVAAAYALALRWRLSGDARYADAAVAIMDAWSGTLTRIAGTGDRFLAAGIYGYEFANAAELLRGYPGWSAAGFQRFQAMMRNVFYPVCHDFLVNHNGQGGLKSLHYWANWDLCSMAAVMSIGVLCDDRALFDEAVDYFKGGAGSGAITHAVYYVHPGHLGQWQESGRDQGHATLGASLMGAVCEMAWNQGVDLYGWDNNRVLMGMEYIARSNLRGPDGNFNAVPFVTFTNEIAKGSGAQTALSPVGQGAFRPCWALLFNHYVRRRGLHAPWITRMAGLVSPEGGGGHYGPNSGGYDQLGYGTLTHTQPAGVPGSGPSGLVAHVGNGAVVLSWWGCVGAAGYSLLRAPAANGPYTTLAEYFADEMTWTDVPAVDGIWYYRVVARMTDGRMLSSDVVSARTGTYLHTRLAMQQTSGTVVVDASGNGRAGTMTGNAGWGAGRNSGRSALVLGGGDGCVQLPAGLVDGLGDFSIAMWVQASRLDLEAKVFDFGAGIDRYMHFTPLGYGGRARFAMTVTSLDGEFQVAAPTALPAGAWVHVAITLKGRSATMYWNGTVVGTHADFIHAPFRLGRTTQNTLGRSQIGNQPRFAGKVDDFRIYGGALSAAQVLALAKDEPVLVDITDSVTMTVRPPTQRRGSLTYLSQIDVVNSSDNAFDGPFVLVLRGLPGHATVLGASGTFEGSPSIDVDLRLPPRKKAKIQLQIAAPARESIVYTPRLMRAAS